jgi:signal peptidase
MDADVQQRTALQCGLVADVARAFGEVRLKVTGASMVPAVWPGDILVVKRLNNDELQPGQIVLCLREGGLMAHRMIRRTGDRLITRGDSLLHSDPPVHGSEVVGPVTSILRNGRHISPEQSFWQRAGSSILRRSDFSTRMTLRLGRLLRRLRPTEMSWAS